MNDEAAAPPFTYWLRELPYFVPLLLNPLMPVRPSGTAAEGRGQPVLVFPGLLTSDVSTVLLRRSLDSAGYRAHASNLGFVTGITPATLADAVERLAAVAETEQRRVVLLGWSLGGIYARVLAQRHPELVELVMTLGTPFSGDRHANNAWRLYEALNDHSVDAPPIADDPALKPPVPTIAVWSRWDGIVAPAAARGLPHERDAEVEVPYHHFAMGSFAPAVARVTEELGRALLRR